ncbi:Uncharacterised protein [Salmonella enterica subsp. enterica serovar Bovismorbificans]|uniref:Uncharacterized protein n=1 Tax=Salmonella enterica subsp. enterica serovar Bovismorbificans TaxID=58097 RepID=A0A655E4S0_SALET|nr:Uncharacterised protein [Salmonella enterica subsp. enterica serovar Bovismorbificans]
MIHSVQHGTKRRRRAGHLQTHIESFGHSQLRHDVVQALFRDVDRAGDAHFARQLQTVFIDVSNHHMTRANMFRHRGGHYADWPRPRYQYIFADKIERQRRMHRITKRVENRG